MNTFDDLNPLLQDFQTVAKLAGINLLPDMLILEKLPAPHKPPSRLPERKMAVYVFFWNHTCLKVGKVGPKSQARYTSQHYNPSSSMSNLAKSLVLRHKEIGLSDITETNVGDWMKTNTNRINFLLDVNCGIALLSLLEAFLHCRLQPKFEGFKSQQ